METSSGKMVTSRGVEIEFMPIPPRMLQKFDELNPEPEPPFYEVTTATGAKERHEHTDTTVKTDAEKAALAEYNRKRSEHIDRFIKFFCLRGIKVSASYDDWVDEQTFLELPVPESKAAAKYEWLIGAVLSSVDDYKAVVIGIMQASGVPDNLLAQVSEQFRGDVEGHPDAPAADTEQPMESVTQVPGGVGSDKVEHPADPVRPAATVAQSRIHPVLADPRHDGRNRRSRA